MCQAVTFQLASSHKGKVCFTQAAACLPIQTRSGKVRWIAWGRRLQESGELPYGGTLLRHMLTESPCQELFPRPVKILLTGFFLRDLEDRMRYYPLVKNQLLQGVLLASGQEARVYVLMTALERSSLLHLQWPRIVNQQIAYPQLPLDFSL